MNQEQETGKDNEKRLEAGCSGLECKLGESAGAAEP